MDFFREKNIIETKNFNSIILPCKIERKILLVNENKNKYISIFPNNRVCSWTYKHRHFSINFYNKIIKYINEYTSYTPIIITQVESIPNLNAYYVKNQKEQIEHLNNSAYIISPHSGFIDYSIVCNVKNAIILWKPFGKECSGKNSCLCSTEHYHKLLADDINDVNIFHLEDTEDENIIFDNMKKIIK
jgi:hypothetical protein